MSIVFRYLASHWYESLRDACFLASPPNKFNDFFDCASGTEGDVPEEEIKRYFSERDWFGVFMRIAQREGLSLDLVTQVLNSLKFNINSLDLDNRIRLLLASRASFSKIYRIVCFSALPNNPIERIANERRMWKRYADKDRGVRIGVDFSYSTRPIDQEIILPVIYFDQLMTVDLSSFTNAMIPAEKVGRIVFTKNNRLWGRECEVRLVTSPIYCLRRIDEKSGQELCFWEFNREMVRQIFLGARYSKNQFKGLMKMLDKFYPWIEVYRTNFVQQERKYKYNRIR